MPVILDGDAIGAVSTFRDIGDVMRTENVVRRSLSAWLAAKYKLNQLIHVSPAMRDVVELGKQYARTDSTILVIGETCYRMSRTAEHLGISRTTLWRKMKELGLD